MYFYTLKFGSTNKIFSFFFLTIEQIFFFWIILKDAKTFLCTFSVSSPIPWYLCGTEESPEQSKHTHVFHQGRILHLHAKSSWSWSSLPTLSQQRVWFTVLLSFLLLVQDQSQETCCFSSVDQLWTQDIWIFTSIYRWYSLYFNILLIPFTTHAGILTMPFIFLPVRRLCVCSELWWQLWALAQYRSIPA